MKKILLLCLQFLAYANLHAVCLPVDHITKDLSLTVLEQMAIEDQCEPLVKAIRATKKLYENYKHPGIKQWRFLRTAFYIEANLPIIKAHQKRFLTKKETGLKHPLEYDPASGHTFIVLNSKKAFIGNGKKKKVFKSILYKDDPKVVARGEQTRPMDGELDAHRALRGANGIMRTFAFTTHKMGKKKYTTIYADLYQGTFQELLEKNNLEFRDKLTIMHDVLKGLESIHSRNLVHRDLHVHNYLLEVRNDPNGKKTFHAVIADLGRTIDINQAKRLPAQGSKRLCPPEGFNQKKLKGKAYFATDIYALGCIFYRLFHNKLPKWQDRYLKSDDLSPGQKKKILVTKLKKETCKRRKFLARKSKKGTLTIKQDAEYLILQMIHKNPKKRGTAGHWQQESLRILHRLPS